MTPSEVLSNTLAFKQSPTCFIVSSDSTPLDIVELWSLTLDQRCCSRTATGSLLSASRPHVGLVCCSESPTSIRKRLRNESAPPAPHQRTQRPIRLRKNPLKETLCSRTSYTAHVRRAASRRRRSCSPPRFSPLTLP